MKVKVFNQSKNELPKYATAQSSGLDIRANLDQPIIIKSGCRALISTGLSLEIPQGYEAQIRARSGLALKHGITLANGIGTIDADYRGVIGVILINLSNAPYVVNGGDRIAQLVFSKVERIAFNLVAKLDTSIRGDGGFGSTGKA